MSLTFRHHRSTFRSITCELCLLEVHAATDDIAVADRQISPAALAVIISRFESEPLRLVVTDASPSAIDALRAARARMRGGMDKFGHPGAFLSGAAVLRDIDVRLMDAWLTAFGVLEHLELGERIEPVSLEQRHEAIRSVGTLEELLGRCRPIARPAR